MASAYDIVEAFKRIEDELIASMIRNMDRHRAEETDEGIQWSMWQAEQLKSLEHYKKENQKKYKKQFRAINKQIEVLIQEARERGDMQQEIAIFEAIKKGFTKASKISAGATAEFFKLNDRKLEALIEATVKDMEKAEIAILRRADDQYRKAIFNAQVYANTGAGTYEKAVDMATRDMLAAGLNCVEYANGARHTLADYADMAIRTASKRAYLMGEGQKRQEWGIHTVIVNKRGNPCPKCLPFCGKVLIDDVWSGGSRKDGKYPLMSHAVAYGLYHPRCKDSHTTYFPGISTADDTWTQEEIETVEKKNSAKQKRQYAQRQVKKYERLENLSLDEENRRCYASRRTEWQQIIETTDYLKVSGEAPTDVCERFDKEYSLVPERHRELVEDEIQKVKVDSEGNSRYDRVNGVLYLGKTLEEGEAIHEMAHAIETSLKLYQDEYFLRILKSGLENFSWENLTYVPDEYGKPVCFLQNSKFISEYQGRMYEEAGFWDDNDEFNAYALAEYFAEGYREYIFNPVNLQRHDKALYDFIEGL